jgi:hypothetical protein
MPVKGTAAHTSTGPRPPLADRLTPAQWLALDAVAAVLVALWVVFDLRLRHGFRSSCRRPGSGCWARR